MSEAEKIALRDGRERIEAWIKELWAKRGLGRRPYDEWSEADHAYSVALSNVDAVLWDALDGHK